MKSFLEMCKIIEAAELGTNKPAPLSSITPELAKVASQSGHKDNNPQDDKAAGANPEDKVAVGQLKPMQKEVIPSKALAFALGFLKDGTPDLNDMEAIVSQDGYIMDGHHRWAARTLIDPNAKVTVAKVGLPASSLVTALNIWTKAMGRSGNSGKGDVTTFASNIPQVLDQFIQNGTDQWPKLTAEEVKASLGKVPGANGNAEQGKQIMIANAQKLPTQKHPDAPERVDMPVVNGKKEIDDVVKKLMNGDIDWNKPFSADTSAALGSTNVSVGAGVSNNTSGNTVATPNAYQQNVGATGGQSFQQNVGAQQPQQPQPQPQVQQQPQPQPQVQQQQQPVTKKFPQQQQPQQQRQVASTSHDGPSLNEWLILSGVKKNEL
jgi:hypothetical protein